MSDTLHYVVFSLAKAITPFMQRDSYLYWPYIVSSIVIALSGRDPADSGRLRKALPPLVEGLLKLAGPVDGFLRRQVAQGCKSSAGVQGVHYQPAFFKHSLTEEAP